MCGRSDQTSLKYLKDMDIYYIWTYGQYYIYRKLCQFKNFILTKEKCSTVEIPSKHKHTLLEDISKACFIKTKTIAKITELINSKLDNEIIFFNNCIFNNYMSIDILFI